MQMITIGSYLCRVESGRIKYATVNLPRGNYATLYPYLLTKAGWLRESPTPAAMRAGLKRGTKKFS